MTIDFTQIFWPTIVVVCLLFIIGVSCVIATNNLIRSLIGIEIMIKAATLLIILVGHATGREALAQSLVITLIVIEVVIMVIASGIILNIFKTNGTVDVRVLRKLKG